MTPSSVYFASYILCFKIMSSALTCFRWTLLAERCLSGVRHLVVLSDRNQLRERWTWLCRIEDEDRLRRIEDDPSCVLHWRGWSSTSCCIEDDDRICRIEVTIVCTALLKMSIACVALHWRWWLPASFYIEDDDRMHHTKDDDRLCRIEDDDCLRRIKMKMLIASATTHVRKWRWCSSRLQRFKMKIFSVVTYLRRRPSRLQHFLDDDILGYNIFETTTFSAAIYLRRWSSWLQHIWDDDLLGCNIFEMIILLMQPIGDEDLLSATYLRWQSSRLQHMWEDEDEDPLGCNTWKDPRLQHIGEE